MFDLKKSIAKWRQQMLTAGIKTPVPLEELEIHLREEIEQQIKSGLNEQKAFEIAVGKIGQANLLKQEFQKINPVDKMQRQKRIARISSILIFGFYSLAITWLLLKNDLTFKERLSGFTSVATMLLSVYVVWRILPRFFPIITGKTAQSAIGIFGSISGMGWMIAFAWFILPRCDFTQGQLLVAVFWGFVPMMLLPITAFLVIDKSESRQFAPPGS
jgi:hypothetical protein